MAEHLPECWASDQIDRTEPLCVCDRLRACEQRVEAVAVDTIAQAAAEAEQRHLTLTQQYGDYRYREGRAAGVQAAREAVAIRLTQMGYDTEDTNPYLAAIDAQRGDSN